MVEFCAINSAGRDNSADRECPADVLATGECRVGTHQNNNFYVVDEHGVEYYIGAFFRASYGPVLVERLRRAAEARGE